MVKTTYICYHFSPGLVPLSVVGPLLFLLQHTLSRCAVLQGKFTQDLAKAMNADFTYCVYRMAQEQQKSMKPADVERNITIGILVVEKMFQTVTENNVFSNISLGDI